MHTVSTDSYIRRKLPHIAWICTIFVTYPNVVWIPWNLERLAPGEEPGFWAFFIFRILYFYGLFHLQLRHNLQTTGHISFPKRFGNNLLYTFAGCSIFILLSYGLPLLSIQTGYVGNILIFQFVVVCLLCTFIGYIAAIDKSQREKEKEIERLRVENLQNRYDALVHQINPHFLFNSLNGISSLIRQQKEEETILYVDRLSDIFRYILQSDHKGLVSLHEELAFIRAFLHVLEVRFANKLTCTIEVAEEKLPLQLPVLSLLPLIENITVHNIIDSRHRMDIRIRLTPEDEVEVSNPIYPKLSPPDTNGTGLHNLRNRFILMTDKDIRVHTDGKDFTVYLPLTDPKHESIDCGRRDRGIREPG